MEQKHVGWHVKKQQGVEQKLQVIRDYTSVPREQERQ